MNENSILYQVGPFWICRADNGLYEVMEDVGTHAKRRCLVGYRGESGFDDAKKRAHTYAKNLLTQGAFT